jgi:crossover junction endodeoxyribonuclease RuvC
LRILGIDPGTAITGFGVIDRMGNRLLPQDFGVIRTPSDMEMPNRLTIIYRELINIIRKYQPEAIAVEQLFFNRNVTTAISVGQARGVVLLAAAQLELAIAEYTPLQVKQAVVGFGTAEKKQVQEMVRILLNLESIPRPDDAADALAIAICHAHSCTGRNLDWRCR